MIVVNFTLLISNPVIPVADDLQVTEAGIQKLKNNVKDHAREGTNISRQDAKNAKKEYLVSRQAVKRGSEKTVSLAFFA